MRRLFIICLMFISGLVYSQKEQFKMQFNYVSYYKNGKWSKVMEGKNTFVFNVGNGNDILLYSANNKREIFTKVSEIREGKTDDGEGYQVLDLLDEEGNEVLLFLYDIGILKLVYDEDFQIQFDQ